jgi:hypothetical protein
MSDVDRWNDEGGAIDEDYDIDGDREPKTPIRPNKTNGAEAIPEEELVLV